MQVIHVIARKQSFCEYAFVDITCIIIIYYVHVTYIYICVWCVIASVSLYSSPKQFVLRCLHHLLVPKYKSPTKCSSSTWARSFGYTGQPNRSIAHLSTSQWRSWKVGVSFQNKAGPLQPATNTQNQFLNSICTLKAINHLSQNLQDPTYIPRTWCTYISGLTSIKPRRSSNSHLSTLNSSIPGVRSNTSHSNLW